MKRILGTLALVFLAVCGLGAWYGRHQAAAARAERWQVQREENAAEALLERPIQLHGTRITLGQLRELIAVETGLEVTIDEAEIAAYQKQQAPPYSLRGPAPAPRNLAVRLPTGTLPLGSGLTRVLSPLELGYEFNGAELIITTAEAVESRLKTVVYPLPQPTMGQTDEHDWAELVTTTVEPWNWDEVGGRGHLEAVPGALIVVSRPAIHREVRQLLATLANAEIRPPSPEPRSLPPLVDTPERRRVLAALDQPASMWAIDKPLEKLLADLSTHYGLPIVVDTRHLEEAGIAPDTPVTKRFAPMPLASVLRHVLRELDLTFMVRDGAVLVTTPEEAEAELLNELYSVHDLVASPRGPDFDSLIDLITTNLTPPTWADVGGPGTISAFGDGWLVVSQSADEQARLAIFLAQLRRGLQRPDQPTVLCPWHDTPATQAIYNQLEQACPLDFAAAPLDEVCRRLADELGVNVTLDTKRIQEAGVRADQPISWHLPAIPLKSQLYWMLRELDLMWVVRDDALVITTTADAELAQVTRLYDVRNLTDPDLGLPGGREALESLIHRFVAPDSWDEMGGPGSLSEFHGLLVASHVDPVHDELAEFLAALDRCRPRLGGDASAPEGQIVRVGTRPSEERIERMLSQPVSANYCGVPLEEVLRDLAERLELPVVFDQAAVVVEGYDFRELVSIAPREQPLAEVLNELFDPRQFAYEIRDDVLFFTFKTRAQRSQYRTRLYNVTLHVPAGDRGRLQQLAAELVADDPYYWDERQRISGVIAPVGDGWLMIAADWRKHRQVERWLAARPGDSDKLRRLTEELQQQIRQQVEAPGAPQ
jgi:hypothetical protein